MVNKNKSKKGYKTHEDIQNFADMYEAYHNLHGNSFIEQTAKIFARLPTEEEYKNVYMLSIYEEDGIYGVASSDLQTGYQ